MVNCSSRVAVGRRNGEQHCNQTIPPELLMAIGILGTGEINACPATSN